MIKKDQKLPLLMVGQRFNFEGKAGAWGGKASEVGLKTPCPLSVSDGGDPRPLRAGWPRS